MTFPLIWTCLFWIWTGSEAVIAIATRTRRGQGRVADRGSQILLWIAIVLAISVCEWSRQVLQWGAFPRYEWVKIAALTLLIAGLAIRAVAIFSLGRSFSANVAIRQSQSVKRTGLYRVVRHPSYLGLSLIFLAIGIHSANWVSLLTAFIPPMAALLYRIQIEESALQNAFGQEYIEYSRATKRLLPGIY